MCLSLAGAAEESASGLCLKRQLKGRLLSVWEWFLRGVGLVVVRVCALTVVTRALSSGACARAVVVIQCLCVLVSSVIAGTRFVAATSIHAALDDTGVTGK